MSFEIIFKYHESQEGGYNREETKEKVVKVGKPFEDTPLEEVAGKIIAQLARRNILVVDVEIYEYHKKKVTYQEAEDGIKIKGRKFSFDDGPVMSSGAAEPDVQEQLLSLLQSNPSLVQQLLGQNQPAPSPGQPLLKQVIPGATNVNLAGPIRYELFDPVEAPPPGTIGSLGKGWKFTKGKKYPIYQEKPASANPLAGMLYTTMDDEGKKREVSDKYFIVPPRLTENFIEDKTQYVGASGPEPQLSFGGGTVKSDMPDLSQLRRRK